MISSTSDNTVWSSSKWLQKKQVIAKNMEGLPSGFSSDSLKNSVAIIVLEIWDTFLYKVNFVS